MIQTKTHRKHHFTPLRYPGGKTSLFQFFDTVIRAHGWREVMYIEPYAGGAGAALSLLLLEKVDSIVINDYDPAIFAFWRSILYQTDAFIEKIETTPLNINEWEIQKQIYKNADLREPLELGFATFFLNRTNRSGVLNAGPIGGKNQSGNWNMDARYNKKSLIDRINHIALYKNRITVTNKDGVNVIKKYAKNQNSFFYIDPPYFVKGGDLYLNAFKIEHHQKLAITLAKYLNTKWLLSYDNEKEIRNLYKGFNYEVFSLKYSAHHNSKSGSELMVFSNSIDKELVRKSSSL